MYYGELYPCSDLLWVSYVDIFVAISYMDYFFYIGDFVVAEVFFSLFTPTGFFAECRRRERVIGRGIRCRIMSG